MERRNFFISRGWFRSADRSVSLRKAVLSGRLRNLYEKVTAREGRDPLHWIVIELVSADLTTVFGVYCDARAFNSVAGVVSMVVRGERARVGDEVAVRLDEDGLMRLTVNGDEILVDALCDYPFFLSLEDRFGPSLCRAFCVA